ncbi:MAG: hypothetical protein PHN35_00565 [Clostridia bacterium]|nr:hypothetical protein [Clostridia bacterium]
MKKLSVLLIMVVILFTALSLPAAAADYTIDDFSMQLSLPDNYLIYTRNMTGSEPVFQKYNLTKAQIDDWFNQSNAYFLAYNQELTQSFYIEITEDIDTRDIFNLNYCDEQKLAEILKFGQRELALESESLSLVNSSMYGTATIPYFYYEFIFHEGMEDSPLLNYSTYYNGRSFDFYFINYDGEITAEQSQLLQNIINSVKFSVTLDKPQDTSINKQYSIKELGLNLDLNDAFDVRLSDGTDDNGFLTAVAIDGTPGFITLEAWEDERSRQIFSFANLPEAELKTFAEDFTVASLQTNKVYDDYQIYTSPEINFVSFWYYSKKDDGELVRVQEIYTVYNGKVFRIIYCGMEGGLDWAHSNMLVNMVKSFDLPAAQKAPPAA